MKENINVIARFAALFIVLLNMILTALNINPLKVSGDFVYEFVSIALTFGVTIWTTWKNNSLTSAAKTADAVMNSIKAGAVAEEDIIALIENIYNEETNEEDEDK